MIVSSAGTMAELIGEGAAWGMSTSVDLHGCRPETIRSRERIQRFVVELCELIGMRPVGDCQIVHFGEGRMAGFSMLQLIEKSLISGHFANDTNRAYLDIFSSKAYDPTVVEKFARRYFRASYAIVNTTLRR